MSSEERFSPQAESGDRESSFGDLIQNFTGIANRRKWPILGLMAAVTVAAAGYSLSLPDIFESEATVEVVNQAVSQRYVTSDVAPISEMVIMLQHRVLSQASLAAVAQKLDLYPQGGTPSERGERLSADLTIEPQSVRPNQLNAIRVAYTHTNPSVAQAVTGEVVTLFLAENRRLRGDHVESTQNFLEVQAEEAREKLATQESRVQEFMSRNLGRLPEQQAANLQILGDLRNRLASTDQEIERNRRDRRDLQSQVSDRIDRLQAERTKLLSRLTMKHPEVEQKSSQIALYSALLNVISSSDPSGGDRSRLTASNDVFVTQTLDQAQDNGVAMEDLRKMKDSLQRQIGDIQASVNAAPLKQQELAELTRDLNLYRSEYESLKADRLRSGLTAKLEDSEQGEHFRIVDAPTSPRTPIGPNRLKFGAAGAGVGLLLGLLIALVLENMDTTFQSEKAVSAAVDVPLVIGIPLILTEKEQSAQSRRVVIDWVAALALIMVVFCAELYLYMRS